MKTLLFTGCDAAMKPLGDLTLPRMKQYAEARGWEFVCSKVAILDVPNGIYWTGVAGARNTLTYSQFDRVIYLDCDQMVTNFDFELPKWDAGFHVSRDWGMDATEPWHFSACGFVAHKDTLLLFEETLSMEPEWRDKSFPEQGPLREVIRKRIDGLPMVPTGNYEGQAFINIHPRRVFNAVPDEVCPGNVPEPWQPGDWCCHLTMLPIDARVNLFHEIASRL